MCPPAHRRDGLGLSEDARVVVRIVVATRLIQTDLTDALRMFLALCIRNTCPS
ncbi:MAG: hypothetical protein QOJ24_4309, partial [Mycobacterium sp.]|nr:hypothetical protein [Mycobacterium sp.]